MMGKLVPTSIVDKNGKRTTVHRKAFTPGLNPAVSLPPAQAAKADEFGERAFAYALEVCSENPTFHEFVPPILEDLADKYGNPSVGRTRAVFDMGDGNVIKVPLNQEGAAASRNEYHSYNMDDPFIPVAKCDFYEEYERVPLLIMEKVDTNVPDRYGKDKPDWVSYVDGAQVGYNSKGELVAYDL
jgi:hypothetical protein